MESRHQDNPVLHDGERWTKAGTAYMAKLEGLTGVRRARLFEGRWAAAEGLIYETWDPTVHLLEELPPAANDPNDPWPRMLSVDFGYENPFVCQWWARDPDDRMYLYRELYGTHRLVSDWAKRIRELSSTEPRWESIVTDHDAEDRATLERELGFSTTAADKAVGVGIQAVQDRLRVAGDGRPRLSIVRGALVDRDPRLAEAKRPCSTIEEFDAYVWAKASDGRPKDQPVKVDDHGMDAMRYAVMARQSPRQLGRFDVDIWTLPDPW
jgi:phage terminase large subunit